MVDFGVSQIESKELCQQNSSETTNISKKRSRKELSDFEENEPSKKSCFEDIEQKINNKTHNFNKTNKSVNNDFNLKENSGNPKRNIDITNNKAINEVDNRTNELKTIELKNCEKVIKCIDKKERNLDTDCFGSDIKQNDLSIEEKKLKEVKMLKKKRHEDIEIINGVELIVECASDQESSDLDEIEENLSTIKKTVIVRETPNVLELHASSSENEISSMYKVEETKIEIVSSTKNPAKENEKQGKKESSRKISSESDNSDDDYILIAKTKVRKSLNPKKNPVKSIISKKGRGRPRGRPPKHKNIEKISSYNPNNEEQEKAEEEEHKDCNKINEKINKEIHEKIDNLDIDEKLNESKVIINNQCDFRKGDSISETLKEHKSDNESNDNAEIADGKKRKFSQRNIKKIDDLKKFIRVAGIRVQCYQILLKDCKTDAAKVRYLKEFLEKHGIIGRPTLEKCRKIKIKNESIKEVQELDIKNIISETRSTRGRNSRKPQIESSTIVSSPQRNVFKKIDAIVDSSSTE